MPNSTPQSFERWREPDRRHSSYLSRRGISPSARRANVCLTHSRAARQALRFLGRRRFLSALVVLKFLEWHEHCGRILGTVGFDEQPGRRVPAHRQFADNPLQVFADHQRTDARFLQSQPKHLGLNQIPRSIKFDEALFFLGHDDAPRDGTTNPNNFAASFTPWDQA